MIWIDEVQEETDNRIVVHIEDTLKTGVAYLKVRTVDSDVIVILLSFIAQLKKINQNVNILIEFGTGNH